MLEDNIDEFFYITVMNENYPQPATIEGIEEDVIRGMYKLTSVGHKKNELHVQLLGSGTILREVESAADLLNNDFGVSSEIWSVTSFNELARSGHEVERRKRLNPGADLMCHVENCMKGQVGPVIAASDYVKPYADQIRGFIRAPYHVLGTDGFGRSDSRISLRKFFEVDRTHIALASLQGLYELGHIPAKTIDSALAKYNIDRAKPNPMSV